jgi:hypothetical protein
VESVLHDFHPTVALTLPVVFYSEMIQEWFG